MKESSRTEDHNVVGGPVLTLRVAEEERALKQEALLTLQDDLLRSGVAVEPTHAEGPEGSKSGLGMIVELAITGGLAAASVRAIQQILIAYLRREGARRVELTLGKDKMVLDATSRREQREALRAWFEKHSAS
ncbi:hypothetical protein [Actinoplanes sp. GCM10030250]|uniref:hypothetical protein n=1 Tax=Actinoplanes sp. GCM10030250 TaxID=3273376 RepID=UPI0036164C44